jgi:SAM-dependent methyltransferase
VPDDGWSAWELAEAFHLAHAVDYLVANDLLDDQERPAVALAETLAVDPDLLAGLLELLARRTGLVVRGPAGFRRGPGLGPVAQAVIDQYVGAYGPNAAALPTILASPQLGRGLVDRARHARAFARAPGPGAAMLPDLLRKLGLGRVLDLGCGTGGLLATMARDPEFRGCGVDANPDMIRVAEQRLRAGGVGDRRVRLYVGDATDPATAVPDQVLRETATVVAASVLNEFFHPDPAPAVDLLRKLRQAMPGRILVVADYYGTLGHPAGPGARQILHDWVQLISSQGVPPPDLDGWEEVYRQADCTLVHSIEDGRAGVFIHLVRLGDAPGQPM